MIELKRDTIGQLVLNQLYKHTQLQDTFGVNMLVLVDGQPRTLSMKEMLTEYIRHRLKQAGSERDLFSSDAVALIHEETHGRLRDIDRVATDALKLAARRKLRSVDRELVVRVFGEQEAATDD